MTLALILSFSLARWRGSLSHERNKLSRFFDDQIKSHLVAHVNKDYAKFVSLSAPLEGFEESVRTQRALLDEGSGAGGKRALAIPNTQTMHASAEWISVCRVTPVFMMKSLQCVRMYESYSIDRIVTKRRGRWIKRQRPAVLVRRFYQGSSTCSRSLSREEEMVRVLRACKRIYGDIRRR